MQIEEKGDFIKITADSFESVWAFLERAGTGIVIWVVLVGFILTDANGFEMVIGLIIVFTIGWLMIGVLFGVDEIHAAQIDKNKKSLVITKRWALTFWLPRKIYYSFREVKSITFGSNQETEKQLAVNFKNKEQEIFAGSATIKDAEKIGIALHVPLNIDVSGEMISYIPWDTSEAEVIPTPCMQCGAPLPKITHEMRNVKCDHCGMTMVIEWLGGKLSYKVQRNSPFQNSIEGVQS
jgi:hypothetical protein